LDTGRWHGTACSLSGLEERMIESAIDTTYQFLVKNKNEREKY
jgi:hypothetical protein